MDAPRRFSRRRAQARRSIHHGLGVGDVNGDGKNDIVIADGWWEATCECRPQRVEVSCREARWPAQRRCMPTTSMATATTTSSASSPHGFGMWWHEQIGKDEWKQHEIDKTFSQTHASAWPT